MTELVMIVMGVSVAGLFLVMAISRSSTRRVTGNGDSGVMPWFDGGSSDGGSSDGSCGGGDGGGGGCGDGGGGGGGGD